MPNMIKVNLNIITSGSNEPVPVDTRCVAGASQMNVRTPECVEIAAPVPLPTHNMDVNVTRQPGDRW